MDTKETFVLFCALYVFVVQNIATDERRWTQMKAKDKNHELHEWTRKILCVALCPLCLCGSKNSSWFSLYQTALSFYLSCLYEKVCDYSFNVGSLAQFCTTGNRFKKNTTGHEQDRHQHDPFAYCVPGR